MNKVSKIFWFVLLFILGSVGVMFILPNFWTQIFFFLLALGILVWTAIAGQQTDINGLGLLTAYVFSVALFGLHFYFRLPAWLVMIVSFIWIFTIFALSFQIKLGKMSASAKILSLTLALVGAQIAVSLLFWPTHFLVTSTVFFLLFYLAWMTSSFYVSGLLNLHRIMIHWVFVSIVIVVLLITAQWSV